MLCPRCQRRLDSTEFSVSSRRSTGRQLWCRTCKSKYDAELYQRKREKKRRRRRRKKEATPVAGTPSRQGTGFRRRECEEDLPLLAGAPCVECGEDDPVVLEFEVRGRKTSSVRPAPARTWCEAGRDALVSMGNRGGGDGEVHGALRQLPSAPHGASKGIHRSIEVQLKLAVGIEPDDPRITSAVLYR